jgi:acyl-coenzyme A synthetase/AMP-(fatty) acid ligase
MGGSVPSQALIDRIRNQLDCTLYNTYGSTEAGHVAIYPVSDEASQTFSVRPPVHLEIVDENDQPLPINEVGIIRYKNLEMSHSYYNNKEATAEFFRDGYFYPGDMGLIDGNGGVVLHGRRSETINLGGAKLNPEIIDRIALAQLGVVDAAGFALLGGNGVEQLAIALVADSDFNLEVFEATMKAKSPFNVIATILMEAIPRNENGKVLRSLLSERHQGTDQG